MKKERQEVRNQYFLLIKHSSALVWYPEKGLPYFSFQQHYFWLPKVSFPTYHRTVSELYPSYFWSKHKMIIPRILGNFFHLTRNNRSNNNNKNNEKDTWCKINPGPRPLFSHLLASPMPRFFHFFESAPNWIKINNIYFQGLYESLRLQKWEKVLNIQPHNTDT